jgi:hypothetical protein
MADPPGDPVAEPHTRPRWVKPGMILGALALLFVILSLIGVLPGGPGGHGPGRHLGGDATPPAGSSTPGAWAAPPTLSRSARWRSPPWTR